MASSAGDSITSKGGGAAHTATKPSIDHTSSGTYAESQAGPECADPFALPSPSLVPGSACLVTVIVEVLRQGSLRSSRTFFSTHASLWQESMARHG
eukprot:4899653-Amphidinium_carterae.2